MALEPGPDPLDRALQAARADEPDGWIELSASIMSRVRSVVTPAEPVIAHAATGSESHDDAGSRTWVSSRVLVAALRRLLQQPMFAPVGIDLRIEQKRLVGVELSLVCSYGPDLVELAESVRVGVHAELLALLGPDPEFDLDDIGIHFSDVVVGNPNLV